MAIVRLIFALSIVFSGTLIGLHCSRRLSRRREILREFIRLLTAASLKIAYTGNDLAEVFSENFAGYPFEPGASFADQWREWIGSMRDVLRKDDLTLLQQFAEDLGTTDTEAQQRHFRMFGELLEAQLHDAEQELEQKGRLYRILPLSASVILALFII